MIKQILFLSGMIIFLWAQVSWAKVLLSFEGQMDFSHKEIGLLLNLDNQNTIKLKGSRVSEKNYLVSFTTDHFKMPSYDVSTDIESSFTIEQSDIKKSIIQGQVKSQYSLIDLKPMEELQGEFEIIDNRLNVSRLSLGKVSAQGAMDLTYPFKCDFFVQFNDVGLSDFLTFFSKDGFSQSVGTVSGDLKISGTADRIFMKGNFESDNGIVRKFAYDSIVLNVEGVYPKLQIMNSRVSQTEGMSFTLDGLFDLTDTEHFTKQLAALEMAPLVVDKGSQLEWTIKRMKDQTSGTTELKYLLRRDTSSIGAAAPNDGMIGVERKVEF